MDKRKLRTSVLAGLLVLALVLSLTAAFLPATANAATSGELKQQLNALKRQKSDLEAEIRSLRNQISENTSEIERMVTENNVIDQDIFLLYQQIENINNQIATYSMLIADKQEELVAAEAKFNTLMAENKRKTREGRRQNTTDAPPDLPDRVKMLIKAEEEANHIINNHN